MEKMEGELERSISAREGVLEQHATALCRRLETLNTLQESMEVRLDDGRPLRVFEFSPDRSETAKDLQASHTR